MLPIPEWMKRIMPKKTSHQLADIFVTVPETTLPGGLVVPAFRIGKYVCSQAESGKLQVSVTGKPWVNINYQAANDACAAAGYQLQRESQRLALAYQIAIHPKNWTGGAVGKGKLYQGLRKWSVKQAQPGNTISANEDERRYFYLPDDQVIFDVAGNVWEWTFDDIQGDAAGLIAKPFAKDSPSIIIPYPGEEKGQGWVPKPGADWSGDALIRGGYWGSGSRAGAFRLSYGWPGGEVDNLGFRCTTPIGR